MGTVNDKLNYLLDTKLCIKRAIEGHGVAMPAETTFRQYADKIAAIPTEDTVSEKLRTIINDLEVSGTAVELAENIETTKGSIKQAIEAQGVSVETGISFAQYAEKIGGIAGKTEAEPEGKGFFHEDVVYCREKANDRVGALGVTGSYALVMTYSSAAVTLKKGGTNQYSIETSDGKTYASSTAETTVTHTWDETKCPNSLVDSAKKIHWFIMKTSGKVIDWTLPAFDVLVLVNCKVCFRYLENASLNSFVTALSGDSAVVVEYSGGAKEDFEYMDANKLIYLDCLFINPDDSGMGGSSGALQYVRFSGGLYASTSSIFTGSPSIQRIDFSSNTLLSGEFLYEAFKDCINLEVINFEAPLFNTYLYGAFSGCSKLKTINLLPYTIKTDDAGACFKNCAALEIIPEIDLEQASYSEYLLEGCTSMKAIHLKNITYDLDISASTKFTAEALVEVMNNLKAASGQTLTMGAANLAKLTAEQKAIATNKGWTLA
ncbi:leucine-rich repeat protein [Eubacterium sp.]|uniref:leucine-rich repeat protein n=1 Tax=Eubacterium sp. TaxID=142586 RepID=UPI0026DFE130|nr:leucine-rich repeat protein [Eubacterium sp.]MDO5432960.1 leucine-rich repeat protein [Eubacterium sp.]